MSFDTCVVSLDLNSRLPIPALRKLATKYTKAGVSSETALQLVLNDQLAAARTQERAIVKAVREAWQASDQSARTPAAEQQRQAGEAPDLNEMFTQLLAEEAAAKPPSDDLNAMFGELLAEVSGVDPRPTVADVVAGEPKKPRRTKAKNRFATDEQEFQRIGLMHDIWRAANVKGKTAEDNKGLRKAGEKAEKDLAYLPPGMLTPAAMKEVDRWYRMHADPMLTKLKVSEHQPLHTFYTGPNNSTFMSWQKLAVQTIKDGKKHGETTDQIYAAYNRDGKAPLTREFFGVLAGDEQADQLRAEPPAKGKKAAPAAPTARAMTHEGRAVDGKALMPGDVFATASGRTTTPFPKQAAQKYLTQWVIDNAVAEAEARGDQFNATGFRAEKPGGNGLVPPTSFDAMHEYLFGQQPAVVKSILKPLAPAAAQALTGAATAEAHIRKFAKTPAEVPNERIRKVLLDAGPLAPEVAGILGEQGHLVSEVGRVMDEFGYKFAGFDDLKPIFTKPGAKQEEAAPERTAGTAAVSAAKNAATGFAAAVVGLGELFGANVNGNAGIVQLDETKYQKAAPLFRAAVAHFGQAAADIRDVMRAVIKAVYEQFGREATANMQPYIVRFTEEYRAGKHQGENENADQPTTGSAARSEEHRADEKPAAEHDIFDVSGAVDDQASTTGRESDEAGREQRDGAGVSGRDAATDRAAGDQRVRAGESGPDGRATERRDTAGSGTAGREGTGSERQPGGDAGSAARARDAQGDKLEQQRQATRVPVQLGDRANIDATLPYLLEPQRDDVAFAEARFAAADKMPGVMFTNGTGTGKTATGAGIIARQVRAGKTEGMIVVPNTGIAQDWIEFGARLGLDIKMLDSTSENGGSGQTITTYANFGANKTLADRSYDWILADESHYLMAAKDGNMTDALTAFRALTRHPDGFHAYSRMKNRDLYEKITALGPQQPKANGNQAGRAKADTLLEQLNRREESQREEYAARMAPAQRPKAIFLSATPFAYVKSVDYAEGYLFSYPNGGKIGKSDQDGRAHFFVQHFGYRIRYHKLTEPDGNVDVGLMARQFNGWLKSEGALSGRMLEVDHDYGRRFIKVESALGGKIDEGMEFMREHPEYKHLYQPFMKGFDYLRRRYLLEAIKAKESLPIIQQHLDMGRKVVVIHDYKKGGASNPFHMTGITGTTTAYDASMSPKSIDLADLAEKFKAERPDLVQLSIPSQSALQTLQSAFPNALVHNGSVPEKQLENNKTLFNSDTSGRNVILLQSDKGREGVSLHDTTGVHQRVEVVVGMASKPTSLIQLEGRVYRTGQKSNVPFDYIVTGTDWERWTFAQTIAERTDIAEALAMGDDARAMKDAIVEAFEDAGPHAITANDGTGGKARDRQASRAVTDWDRARSYYYGQLKRNSGNKSAEGKDYFATPEPVGLKMVEWADIRPGEDVLEPSAGHGAIARWFPTLSNKTINEKETGLIGRARLHVDGAARFIQGQFEDLDVVNKYDAIVMNPPFGLGGSMAIPHLAKAYTHLRDGGRIVALLPRGPAADGKLEKFLYGDKAPKDLYMVADIELPRATFGRAGTTTPTHIVILDKISDPSKAPQQVSRDYASADDIDELFERIQHSTVPGRVKTDQPIEIAIEQQKAAPKKQPREAAAGATGAERFYAQFEFKHTKTGEQLHGAAMLNRTSMDTYKDAAAIAKKHGGWYNKFVGGGALRGFLFKSADERTAFMEEAGQLAEVSAGHDKNNSLTGDLGVDSDLIDHMESIADARGMVQADKLLPWVEQQNAPGAAPLANWLKVMGSATVAQSSVVKFMENSGNAMFSNMPTFYSALARAVPDMAKVAGKDGTIKAEQARLWLAARQKEGKFKAEELQWSGVDDWLKAQGGRVAVADIEQFVSENGVQVEEVKKGGSNAKTRRELEAMTDEELNAESNRMFGEDMDGYEFDEHDRDGTIRHMLEVGQYADQNEGPNSTKYSKYVLPGGENYRELLLTLPEPDRLQAAKQAGFRAVKTGESWEGADRWTIQDSTGEGRGSGAGQTADEALRSWAQARKDLAGGSTYSSSHWDEKNIVAHIRFNDRVDADGKRVLFIEELQSDWGQEGLKQGFATAEEKLTATKTSEGYWEVRGNGGRFVSNIINPLMSEQEAIDEARYRMKNMPGSVRSGVPAAPFVTDTKSWLALGIKRMVRYAAENGYDRVAFVNGAQSADRYSLAKQVSKIEYASEESAGAVPRALTVYGKANETLISKNVTPDELPDIIGKEVAERLLEAQPESLGGRAKFHIVAGDGLKVGGEGMKQFYDKIVPQTINDVLKKLGGGKAGVVTIADAYREPEMTGMDEDGNAIYDDGIPDGLQQPGFDITPELRDTVMQGMPMFSRSFDPGRRHLLATAAAAAMGNAKAGDAALGRARAMDPAVLDQRVSAPIEKIMRRSMMGGQNASGVTNLKGADALRDAMKAISLTGPKEVRSLAAQVLKLLPAEKVMLTIDDTRRMNVHGVVELGQPLHMQLFTAGGRTGLTYGTIIHEALHVVVAARYRSLSMGMARSNDKVLGLSAPAAAKALEQFEGVWNEFREMTRSEKVSDKQLALAIDEARHNPDEFFVRALTDPILQAYMAGKRYEGKTLLERFKDWVKMSLFSLFMEKGTPPSWLDAALAASGDVMQAMGADRGDFARLVAVDRYQASRSSENSRANIQEDTPEFKAWFGDSKVVDEQGAPLVVYHATDSKFSEFRTGEYGAHFGSLTAAAFRADELGDEAFILRVYLSIKNPLRLSDPEGGDWAQNENDHGALDQLLKMGLVSRKEVATISLRDAAERAGYDGIVYENEYEGGGDSYIVFRPEQIKSAIRNNGNFDPSNPNIMASRALPASWTAPEDTKKNAVIQALQDQHLDTKQIVKAVRDAVGDLGDKWDPYLQEELYHGRSATGFKDFLHDELRPLLSDMQARGVDIDGLQEYLHMRHAEEANEYLASINDGSPDGLAGVSTQDAQDYLANLPPAKARAYAALAARVDAIMKGTQQLLVSSGLEKQETIDAWNSTYQHYVPLHREDMANGMRGNGTGSGFAVRGPASKARTGSKRTVVDILANIAMAREKAMVRAEKNRVSMALYGLALQAPNPAFWKPINPKKNPAALDAELLNMGLSPAEKANIGAEPRSKRIGQAGMVESYVNLAARNEPNVLPVRINGEDRFLFFNKDDPRAMRMAEAMKNMGAGDLGWTVGQVARVTRWLAAMNTQYNPVFGIVNLVRDTSEGSINLTSTPINGKQHQVLFEATKLFGKVVMARGRLSNLSGADAALWREFQDEGGITGFRQMFSRSEDRTEELERELRAMSRNPAVRAGNAIMAWLSDYNEALENITRLAAYKVAKESGLTNQRAASVAKNLTVNFNRKGAKTRQLAAFYAFFNAAVQGIARAAETLAAPAGKLVIAGGLLLGAMQSTLLHTWGFDDADIPAFVRAKNLIIPLSRPGHGKNFASIPLPQGFAFLPTLGQTAADFAFNGGKQPGKYGARMLDTMLDTFNPIGGSGNIAQMISPTVFDPITDVWGNRDWTGKKIAIEDRDQLHPTPGHTRTHDTASTLAKFMSHGLNAVTGGTEYSPGAISWTPDQIDYFTGQFGGGVWRELSKLDQTVMAQITGEDLPWNKVPLIGRFYGDVNDKSAISTKFYDNVKELADVGAEVEGRRKAGVSTKQYRADNPDYKLALQADDVLRKLSELRGQRKHWLEKGDKVRVKEYELRMRTVMEAFNAKVAEARAATP